MSKNDDFNSFANAVKKNYKKSPKDEVSAHVEGTHQQSLIAQAGKLIGLNFEGFPTYRELLNLSGNLTRSDKAKIAINYIGIPFLKQYEFAKLLDKLSPDAQGKIRNAIADRLYMLKTQQAQKFLAENPKIQQEVEAVQRSITNNPKYKKKVAQADRTLSFLRLKDKLDSYKTLQLLFNNWYLIYNAYARLRLWLKEKGHQFTFNNYKALNLPYSKIGLGLLTKGDFLLARHMFNVHANVSNILWLKWLTHSKDRFYGVPLMAGTALIGIPALYSLFSRKNKRRRTRPGSIQQPLYINYRYYDLA